jgi:hypothetical protein
MTSTCSRIASAAPHRRAARSGLSSEAARSRQPLKVEGDVGPVSHLGREEQTFPEQPQGAFVVAVGAGYRRQRRERNGDGLPGP